MPEGEAVYGDMFDVVDFTDKTYGIIQVRTGMVAGRDGKPFSFKVRAAAWLKCQDMNKQVREAMANPEKLQADIEARFAKDD